MTEPAKRYYKTLSDNMHLQSENARLKAEVERLTKAGDLVFLFFEKKINPSLYAVTKRRWNAAKEGEGQP